MGFITDRADEETRTDTPAPPAAPAADSTFSAVNSPGLPELLKRLHISLLVTTYQANKLMAVRESQGTIWTLLRNFERPMGLAVREGRQFALGTRNRIWDFRNAPNIAPQIEPVGVHDACFMPRISCVTGDILGHEMAWVGEELWIVNTLFSCLCTLQPDYSFVPRWRPAVITALVPEDRCHLNGLAMLSGQPKYATALGETNTEEGWRPNKATGGILIDIPCGEVVARGLSMPHSPRIYDGRLWLLEGGTGQLQVVDTATGKRETVAQMPGFTRGLAFFGRYAFVGLSKIRESALFGGLPIASAMNNLRCGIWVIDVQTGETAQFMQFQSGVEEIFAVEVLAGVCFPEIIGSQEERLNGVYVIPPP